MRSFVKCVSCWGTTTHEVSMTEGVVTVVATTTREKETKSLMPAGTAAATKRKMNRVRVRMSVGSTRSMIPQWKPSMCSITEDNIVVANRDKAPSKTTTTINRVVKRKNSSGSRSNVHVPSYNNDTRRNSVPAVFLPTFTPAPFMF